MPPCQRSGEVGLGFSLFLAFARSTSPLALRNKQFWARLPNVVPTEQTFLRSQSATLLSQNVSTKTSQNPWRCAHFACRFKLGTQRAVPQQSGATAEFWELESPRDRTALKPRTRSEDPQYRGQGTTPTIGEKNQLIYLI